MLLAERYARATLSGNLRNDALHTAPEVLMAVALAGGFSSQLIRLKFGIEAPSYRRVLEEWTWLVSGKAVRRTWPDHISPDRVAYQSLRYWLNSVCPACTGHGKVKVLGAPVLSEKDCPLCSGSGKTELRCEFRLRDYVLDMVEELDAYVRRGMFRANKKLRSDREDADAKLA
jgi:hypothetical protein